MAVEIVCAGSQLAGLRFVAGEGESAGSSGTPSDTPATASLPVVCLHGWLDNAASFYALAHRLAGSQLVSSQLAGSQQVGEVLALDLPGHGLSPWQDAYPVWGYTSSLVETIKARFSTPVHLVAHSMGGSAALCLAGAFPELVASLTLLDSPGPMITPETRIAQQLREGVEARKKLRPSRVFTSVVDAIEARRKATPALSHAPLDQLVRRNLEKVDGGFAWRTDPKLKLASDLRLSESQVEHLMSAVTCPVLSIRAGSGLLPQAFFEQRMAYLKEVRVTQVAGHHHFHMEPDASEQIATLIRQFHDDLSLL